MSRNLSDCTITISIGADYGIDTVKSLGYLISEIKNHRRREGCSGVGTAGRTERAVLS
jgi:hypothetical protein